MNKMNRKYAIAAAIMFLIAGSASAKDVGSSSSAFKELDALKTQNALLGEALKNAELKAKILEAGKPKNDGRIEKDSSRAKVTAVDLSSAQVMMVSGVGRDLSALIAMGNGRQVVARVGSNVAGLGVVQSIKLNEVLVSSGKGQVSSLAFAGETTGSLVATNLVSPNISGTPSTSMPPFPPMPPSMLNGGR
jgi:type IV pilus biogenesis protein PilP